MKMTREEQLEVERHHANGGKVEYRMRSHAISWKAISEPSWWWDSFYYRIALSDKALTLEARVKELEAQVSELKEPTPKWKPEFKHKYWTINMVGRHPRMRAARFYWDDDDGDNKALDRGLVFRTEKEAEEAGEFILAAWTAHINGDQEQ